MASKEDLRQMQNDIHKSTKNMVSEVVDPIKDQIFEINARFEKVESNPSQNTSNNEAQSKLQEQVVTLEASVSNLASSTSVQKTPTAVFGGLASLGSMQNAITWLKQKLSEVGAPTPVDVYFNGATFTDILFASFSSVAERDAATRKLRLSKTELGGKAVWGNAEAPLEVRVYDFFYLV